MRASHPAFPPPAPGMPRPGVPPPLPRQRHAWLWTCLALLLGALALLPVALAPAQIERYYIALVLTMVTLMPLIVRALSGELDLFEPIIPISLLIGLTFGVRTIYIAYNPNTLDPILSGALPFDDFVDRALLVALASYMSLLAGYFVLAAPFPVTPLAARLSARGWPLQLRMPKAVVLIALGLIGSVLVGSVNRDNVDAATNVVGMLADLVQVTGCLLMLYAAAGDNRPWMHAVTWGLLLPLAAWQSLALGAKAFVLKFCYAVIAARHYGRRRITLATFGVAAVALILLVFPIINTARNSPDPIGELLRSSSPSQYAQLAMEGVLSRATGIDVLSLVMKYDVSDELGNKEAYAAIPLYAFVPRAIWRDKPVLDQGSRFGRLLLIPSFEGRFSVASFGMFHIGDLYVTFGMTGLMIGMCVLGFIYRMIYRFFDPVHTPDLGVKFLYIMLLWGLVSGFESDVPSVWSNLLKSAAILAAIKMWMDHRAASGAGQRRPVPGFRHPAPATR